MKKWFVTFACVLAMATAAQAGSLSDPVVTEDIVVNEVHGSSSGTTLVAMLALLLILPVASD